MASIKVVHVVAIFSQEKNSKSIPLNL
ncbi:uncharacterized protein G2W53_027293 [Senna tora]|uniref:Uncharacterized protein n=1 Tax=Senna tora TaxID=362788 RepID=A0A834WIA6_9FABA|nr:uncharacterized protein G2W53_027293 [Senna tora]